MPAPLKLLVANRSEIACRVFQACRERQIKTVAIVAPGDHDARHVTYADEVEAVSSYLDIDSVVAAAKRSGATLIHPGYGFLSERPLFVRALDASGLTFLGPRAETMEALGDKIGAKELASKHKVPTLPWAKVRAGESLESAAKNVGFPLLLKASAGGGGKGMRRVNHPGELVAAAESASAEAQSSFGDGTLFLERLIENPRHIEVQVFGDGHGGGIHLFERECSLQRRHQKVWEEATAPHLPEKTRAGLFEAALGHVKAVQYRSAGTMEFLVDPRAVERGEGGLYFLEMNARLQVEHPVTELVTGVDLVHLQIDEALARSQSNEAFALPRSETIAARGCAIEVRIYAEDPYQGYVPTPGRVDRLKWPTGAGIRVDSGIEEGQVIGTSFDSMLAKLIVSAPTRALALARLKYALEETVILGIGTNLAWLRMLADQPSVIEGRVDTGLLDRELGSAAPTLSDAEAQLVERVRRAAGTPTSTRASEGPSGKRAFASPWSLS